MAKINYRERRTIQRFFKQGLVATPLGRISRPGALNAAAKKMEIRFRSAVRKADHDAPIEAEQIAA